MNKHSSAQQSMNAQRRNENERNLAIATDREFEIYNGYQVNDIGGLRVRGWSYTIPEKFKNHPLIKKGKQAKVFVSWGSIRGLMIDGEVIFYETDAQFRESQVQYLLINSQWRAWEILIWKWEMLAAPWAYNEALLRKKRALSGADGKKSKI